MDNYDKLISLYEELISVTKEVSRQNKVKLIESIVSKITSRRNILTYEALVEIDKMLDESGIRK